MIYPRPNFDCLGCGATVVSGLGDPDQDPKEMVTKLLKNVYVRFTFYVMADAQTKKTVKNTSGVKLKNYIEEHGLGPIIETQGRHFSDKFGENYIKVYVWRPDYKAETFIKWCKENKVELHRKMW